MPKYPYKKSVYGDYFIFPAYPTLLVVETTEGKNKYIHFNNKARIYCFRNGTIGIKSKNIVYELANVDKLDRIEYKRDEKKYWKKYGDKNFVHYYDKYKYFKSYFKELEKVYKYEDNPHFIRFKGHTRLWGYQNIDDKEVE